jgi:tetraacyldisaccharide 4'-kinase
MSSWLERVWYPSSEQTNGALSMGFLTAASWIFQGATRVRNALYDFKVLPERSVADALVVSVGNLNVGGTGKTPAVIYLANLLTEHGRKAAILTRGYGRQARTDLVLRSAPWPSATIAGDEPLLIAARCPNSPVLVGEDRWTLAQLARKELNVDSFVLDDGFQHRSLRRDLDIVVIDEDVGLGNERLLPRGPLREPRSALRRAQLLWLRGERANSPWAQLGIPWVRTRYSASVLIDSDGLARAAAELKGQRIFAFAAIARPERFLRTLEALRSIVVASCFFEDHHIFREDELERIRASAASAGAQRIVTTEKDRTRLPLDFPAWTLRLDVEIVEGRERLLRVLRLLEGKGPLWDNASSA